MSRIEVDMSTTAPVARRTVRRHSVALAVAGVMLLPAVFFGYFALDGSVPAGQRTVYGVIAALALALAVRGLRIGVQTGPDGITVRGFLRSWKRRWDDVERFEWGRWRGFGAYPVGVVRLRDGSAITVLALNPPFKLVKGQDRRVPRLLEVLNEMLGRARGIPAPDSGAPPDPRA